MPSYLVDTSVLAAYLFGRPAALTMMNGWIRRRDATTSILVYGEIVEYIRSRSDFPRLRTQLRQVLVEIRPYLLTYPIMERYAEIRRQLRPPYGPGLIGDVDTLIAATALERNLALVTTDSDFRKVPGLDVQLIPRRSL